MIALALSLAAHAKAPAPPPPEATAPIALTGEARRVDAVADSKYLHYAVGATIAAPPDVVWSVLTDAAAYPSWNSTVLGIEGTIAPDEDIVLRARIDPKRKFDLTVTTFEPGRLLVWEDGNKAFMGVRTFTLEARPDGTTAWTMKEAFTGSMLPMIAKKLPDFAPEFDAFAADLRREAERRAAASGG